MNKSVNDFAIPGTIVMGILGLSKLLADFAPSAIKDNSIKSYFG